MKALVLLVLVGMVVLSVPSVRDQVERQFYPRKYQALVEQWAQAYQLDPLLVYSFIRTESGFDPGAMPIIFMGGGAGLTKGRVAPRFALSRPIVLNDISLNAKGYEQLCGAVPGDLKH